MLHLTADLTNPIVFSVFILHESLHTFDELDQSHREKCHPHGKNVMNYQSQPTIVLDALLVPAKRKLAKHTIYKLKCCLECTFSDILSRVSAAR